jgi:streptomycin 6-kinase
MQFSQPFVSNVHDIYGEVGDAWLKDLPHRIRHLETIWDFRFLKPMANLSYNFVCLVEMNAKQKRAILKMAPETGTLIPEMRWLKCIEKGVPEMYAFDQSLNAYLMEHLTPGHTLKKLVR